MSIWNGISKRGIDPETGITVRIPKKVSEDTIGVEETVAGQRELYYAAGGVEYSPDGVSNL